MQSRARTSTVAGGVAAFGLDADGLAVLGSFVAGPSALEEFGAGAPENTDDRPIVAYRAPHLAYAQDSSPRERLARLLASLHVRPEELVNDLADATWRERLVCYLAARDRFLEVGQRVQPRADVREMLAQVQAPLLQVLAISPDFEPAYRPLVAMANELDRVEPAAARVLRAELARIQSARERAEHAPCLRTDVPDCESSICR